VDGELRKWLPVTLLLELVLGHKSSTHGQNLGIMNDIVPKRIEQSKHRDEFILIAPSSVLLGEQ
jgi:hypothetical protein